MSLDTVQVMGIVNLTADSFSDGGRYESPTAAIAHAERLIEEGAHLIDLGAESTRPGATLLPKEEEIKRLQPVLRALRDYGVPLSVDTYKPGVMRFALEEGASMINDVRALREAGAIDAVGSSRCALCLMHMQGDPATMQLAPHYDDVVAEVRDFLAARIAALEAAGIARARLAVDPGFGFGKTLAHNFRLLGEFHSFTTLGVATLAGVSRKRMLGDATGRAVDERLAASVAAALAAVARGANLVRVHDVRATVDALKVWEMVENCARTDSPDAGLHDRIP